MRKLRHWLMVRYCPDYLRDMPASDDDNNYLAVAIVASGYWGSKFSIVAEKKVKGIKEAYITARWLALKAQWRYPNWLYSCGINYGVREV